MSKLSVSVCSWLMAMISGQAIGGSDAYERFAEYHPANQFPLKQECVTPGKAASRGNDDLMTISSNEHVGNTMHMDHASHSGMSHENHHMDHDEHAHHRAMLNNKNSYTLKSEHYNLPDIELISQDGHEFDSTQVFDSESPVMVNFIFTTCTTICPVLSATFTEVQELMSDEVSKVKMVSVTIDPEYDTPEKLKEYAEKFSAEEQWNFFTGDVRDIIALERAFKVYRGNKMAHEPTTFIRLHKDDAWVRLDGFASAQDVVKEYKKLAYN